MQLQHHNPPMTGTQERRIAALYARVSTERQEKEATIDSQLDEIKRRIAEDGNALDAQNIFIDDGWSGELIARPKMDAMRDAAAQGKFQVLYVYDRGRLARIYYLQELIINELKDRWIDFTSLHDAKANTPEEYVLQSMQGVFHEYERIKIAERFRRGKLFKAKNGVLINGQVPYGYTRIKKTENAPAYVLTNEQEAHVVRLIFDWFTREHCSIKEIARRLYQMNIQPRKRKRPIWTHGPLERLLKCEAYFTGFVYFNKSQSVVPRKPKTTGYKKIKRSSKIARPREQWIPYPVPKLFDDPAILQNSIARFEHNRHLARRHHKHEYLLTGFIWCGCGYRRVGDSGTADGRNRYYRCSQRIYKQPEPTACKSPGINVQALDTAFWTHFTDFMSNPVLSRPYAEEYVRKHCLDDALGRERSQLTALLEKLKLEEARYVKAFGTGVLPEEHFAECMRKLGKQKTGFQERLEKVSKTLGARDVDPVQVDRLMDQVSATLRNFELHDKRKVLEQLISKIVLSKDLAEVHARIPSGKMSAFQNVDNEPENRIDLNRNFGLNKRKLKTQEKSNSWLTLAELANEPENRHRWAAQRRKIHPLQSPHQKTS